VLRSHAPITRLLIRLFESRFDPARQSGASERGEAITEEIRGQLDEVTSLDADRILRSYLALIDATLRTNYYKQDSPGPGPGVDGPRLLVLKLDPGAIPGIVEPRPKFEIFVFSPRLEAVHLRFGRVARGGLRWSDRLEDFRTEVLGLVKAQEVKNAVIVPAGAKGGFVCKRLPDPADREAYQAEVLACYKTFIAGMLDVTDNIDGDRVVPPPGVVRRDGDDSYLVVAADKGTATFSDTANEIAGRFGYWLGDAFASGGSEGYDHKKMGITARGAWESVKWHFSALGLNPATDDFTAVGVGDMSGDVFGNGVLLSHHIRLVAVGEVGSGVAASPHRPRHRRHGLRAIPGRADLRHLVRPGRPALERRDRHLREGQFGVERRRGGPVQRRGPDRRHPVACPGGRGGRQPRLHPGRPDRVLARRRPDEHRLHRQLGRGGHLRPRGQHQDSAGRRDQGRRHPRLGAARAAERDDRRGGRPGATAQLRAEHGAGRGPGPGLLPAPRARAVPTQADQGQAAQHRTGRPARRAGDRRAPVLGQRPDQPRARPAAGAHQDLRGRGRAGVQPARRPVPAPGARRVFPGPDAGQVRGPDGRPPAAPGDHHHLRGERDDRHLGHHVPVPADRGDRRVSARPDPRVAGGPRGVRHVGLLVSGRGPGRTGRYHGPDHAAARGAQAARARGPVAAAQPPPAVRPPGHRGFLCRWREDRPFGPAETAHRPRPGRVRGAAGFLPGPRRTARPGRTGRCHGADLLR